ncbi:MAG: leucine-rich repeat domain-containing protein [Faecalibacterium sp.]|nr:leucine-rich repeat domain-containing protein [Ruminococcus sp.]MCM1391466.1 leucine-rich repeat domain-containing protein [Ruminococcus sp.]MCM1485276.1 leucine-rich repeat domain-containing protein [Faecalibacterium sp.]
MKQITKKTLSILLAAIMLICTVPLAASAVTVGGECGANGDNVTWSLDTESGVLKIEGEGAMDYYTPSQIFYPGIGRNLNSPWKAYTQYIKSVVISKGVTNIGGFAFLNCTNLMNINIPDSVTSIAIGAFNNCSSLISIVIPKSIKFIDSGAFDLANKNLSLLLGINGGTINLKYAYYLGSKDDWANVEIGEHNELLTNVVHLNGVHEPIYTSQEIITQPTCTKNGVMSTSCFCGAKLTETILATGHRFSNYISNNNATCTTDGTKTAICDICGDATDKIIDKGTALGHDYSDEWTIDKEPTCLEEGIKSRHCIRCAEAAVDITVMPREHHYILESSTREPTCTEDGFNHFYCTICQYSYGEVIPALGHDYSTEWTIDSNSTCGYNGYKSHHCKRCSAKTDITTIEKNSQHQYYRCENLDIVPTCTQEGGKCYSCRNCDVLDFIPIEKIPHNYYIKNIVLPICDKDGSMTHVCIACGDSYDVVIPSTNSHSDTDNNGKCDNCGKQLSSVAPTEPTEPDTESCDCMCHQSGIVGFFWTLVKIFYQVFHTNKTCACGAAHY